MRSSCTGNCFSSAECIASALSLNLLLIVLSSLWLFLPGCGEVNSLLDEISFVPLEATISVNAKNIME